MKEREKEVVREFLIPWVRGYVFCFSNDSTEKWKKMFCQKRLETFLATDKDMIEERTGVKLDNQKNLNDFKKIYENLFMEEVERYLTELKKTKDEEVREEIKKNGVQRKVDSSSNSKKKSKRNRS